MRDDFKKEIISLLKNGGFNVLYPPEQRKVKYTQDNKIKIKLSFIDSFAQLYTPKNFLLNSAIAFMALDMYVDSKYPDLSGRTFAQKVNFLRQINCDKDKVLHNVFRMFKLIRNAITHNANNISLSDNTVEINYIFRNTNFLLKCSKKAIEYLVTIVYMFLTNSINNYREEVYLKSYYTKLISEISLFQDESNNPLDDVSNFNDQFIFNNVLIRYIVELNNNYFEKQSDKIIFKNDYRKALRKEESYSGIDFLINLEGDNFLIPYESINNDCINILELDKWKVH